MTFIIAVMHSLDKKYLPLALACRADVVFLTCHQTVVTGDCLHFAKTYAVRNLFKIYFY